MSNRTDFVAGLILGGLLGTAMALLFAPRPGEETRERLLESAEELRERARERADDVVRKVRDLLLGREPHDLDIVTSARPESVTDLFPHTVLTGAEFGVVTVVVEGRTFQVATFRREGPYLDGRRPTYVEYADLREDVLRRDFTVNALVYDPIADRVLDFTGGLADLERRTLRTVGEPAARFGEDRLRLLRAVRFATELQFSIEPSTLDAIRTLAPTIGGGSAERIRDEVLR